MKDLASSCFKAAVSLGLGRNGLHASSLPGHLSQFAPSRLTRASVEVGLRLCFFGDFLGNYRSISFFVYFSFACWWCYWESNPKLHPQPPSCFNRYLQWATSTYRGMHRVLLLTKGSLGIAPPLPCGVWSGITENLRHVGSWGWGLAGSLFSTFWEGQGYLQSRLFQIPAFHLPLSPLLTNFSQVVWSGIQVSRQKYMVCCRHPPSPSLPQ